MYNHLMNEAVHNGSYTLRVRFEGYPTLAGENFRSRVRVANDFAEPIAFSRAEERWHPCVEGEIDELPAPDVVPVRVEAFLGKARLAPGEAVEFDYRQPRGRLGHTHCGITVVAEGRGVMTGLKAIASWRMPVQRSH